MNRLAAILPPSNVLVDVDATSKKRVFEHAGLLFENQHAIARGVVTHNLFARERLGSTGLGEKVAIPHGRIKGLKDGRARTYFVYNICDHEQAYAEVKSQAISYSTARWTSSSVWIRAAATTISSGSRPRCAESLPGLCGSAC